MDERPNWCKKSVDADASHPTSFARHWSPARFPRHRPGWWPRDESWPPAGPPASGDWRKLRGHLLRRVAILLALLFFFTSCGCLVLSMAIAQFLSQPGALEPPGQWYLAPVILIGMILTGVMLVLGALRRAAIPLGEMMEATGRVAEGDYSVRVAVHGPKEARTLGRAFNTMVERLQNHDQQRRSLLADITHELRTPLTVMQGNLEGMLDGIYPRDDAHLRPVLEETQQLSRLIDDLRTLALAESGALKLEKEPVDLLALLHETVESFRARAAQDGVSLEVAAAAGLPPVEVDATRIRQVIANLISNALRYTPAGGQVQVDAGLADGPQNWVVVTIRDNGAGIPAEDLPYIFDRFHKSRDSGGMGLGLAIARNLVLAHGGTITADSQAGVGTTMRFTLPVTTTID